MRVAVDEAKCQGHARCWMVCPQVFELNEEGHAVIVRSDVPAELESAVLEAEGNCPEQAITVTTAAK